MFLRVDHLLPLAIGGGAGGLVVQHRFGARTGLAPAIFGATCLLLGLLLNVSSRTFEYDSSPVEKAAVITGKRLSACATRTFSRAVASDRSQRQASHSAAASALRTAKSDASVA